MIASKKRQFTPTYVGIDIGKQRLHVAVRGVSFDVSNDLQGWEKLMTEVKKRGRYLQFVCEPTGHVGDGLVEFLWKCRRRLSLVPPLRAREFAKATGRLAKNDRVDARMLAQYGEKLNPPCSVRLRKAERELQATMRCRLMLVRQQMSYDRKLHTVRYPHLTSCFTALTVATQEQIRELDASAEIVISRDAQLSAKHQAFCSVYGIATVAAKSILAEFPEIGRVNRSRAAALAGLAPYDKESGASILPRHIHAGRPNLRHALYMPAVVGITHNRVLGAFYDRLRARGKPAKVALTAVMRKLLIHLNSLAKNIEEGVSQPAPSVKAPTRGNRKSGANKLSVSKREVAGSGLKRTKLLR